MDTFLPALQHELLAKSVVGQLSYCPCTEALVSFDLLQEAHAGPSAVSTHVALLIGRFPSL